MKEPQIAGIASLDMGIAKWFVQTRAGYIEDLQPDDDTKPMRHLALEIFYVDSPEMLLDLINDPQLNVSPHDDPRVKTTGPILFPEALVGTVMDDIVESINSALKVIPHS